MHRTTEPDAYDAMPCAGVDRRGQADRRGVLRWTGLAFLGGLSAQPAHGAEAPEAAFAGLEDFGDTASSHRLIREVFHCVKQAYDGILCKEVRRSPKGGCPEVVGKAA